MFPLAPASSSVLIFLHLLCVIRAVPHGAVLVGNL
jgi:hypothetical protein